MTCRRRSGIVATSGRSMSRPTLSTVGLILPIQTVQDSYVVDGNLAAPMVPPRKGSVSSISSTRSLPPLVNRLEKLYIGENCLTDNSVLPLIIFKELKVLNLSFNEIQEPATNFFHNMTKLEELYLSGNKLTSIPSEDLPRLHKLSTIS